MSFCMCIDGMVECGIFSTVLRYNYNPNVAYLDKWRKKRIHRGFARTCLQAPPAKMGGTLNHIGSVPKLVQITEGFDL